MITTNPYTGETTTYWNMIKDVRDEVKIRLITLLSESLSRSAESSRNSSNYTEKFLMKTYGAWTGDGSDEEIIARINEGKTSKDPVSFN